MVDDANVVKRTLRTPNQIMEEFEQHSKAFDEKMKKILSCL